MQANKQDRLEWIGRSAPREDAFEKVTGRTRYTGDLVVPGMLYGCVVRSPIPHALVDRIDASAATQAPGVVAVLTGADIADLDGFYGHVVRDRPLIAIDRVRFAGEPVAAIAAETPAAAAEAADRIDVQYVSLPILATLEAAMASGAPRIHPEPLRPGFLYGPREFEQPPGNLCSQTVIRRGDPAAAFREAGVVVEGEYEYPMVYQYAMEPHTVIAECTRGGVTVWATCQHPYLVRTELAAIFGLPLDAVRVIVPPLGGGFGSKSYTKMEPLAVALARKAGRPVRITNRIDEAMVTTRRHNMRCWMRTGAAADGRLLARECRIWLDTGAYADNGPRVAAWAASAAPGPYGIPHVSVESSAIYTNTAPAGSYRSFGAAHLLWVGESQIDEIARRLGRDPVDLRRQNLVRHGGEVMPGRKPLDADLAMDLHLAAERLGWGGPKGAWIGRGVCCGVMEAGADPASTAHVRLGADGHATVYASTAELGQGSRTVLTQIAAEELALPLERVRIVGPDTQITPYDRSTGASRSTTLMGTAVHRAAAAVRTQLVDIASSVWGLPPMALEARDGAIWHETERLPYADLLARHFGLFGGELAGHGEVRPGRDREPFSHRPLFWEVAVAAAEVAVDPETGEIIIRRYAGVADVGKAINPRLVEGQDEGAAVQGIGIALFEEMVYEDGQLLNNSLIDYRIPTFEDIPGTLDTVLVENGDGPGPYGAKGVGEAAQAAAPAAIVNALAELGVQMTRLPMTPERVWRALHRST
jgi:CO/xanthine dehydrogenase Mo-binding subunit